MEIIRFVLAGIVMGLPFGPVGILCIGKTLEQGKKIGFSAALGAITVDLIYAVIAFLSLTLVQEKIVQYDTILKIFIGLFLIFIGVKKFIKKPDIKREFSIIKDEREANSCFKSFRELFMISLPNIFNIASLITVFTALDIYRYKGRAALPLLIFTMFIAEISLWYLTTSIFHTLREKITDKSIERFVKGCALLVILLGALLEIKVLIKFLAIF